MTQQQKAARTRFAPSPTGYLHVGGARTALFSWLYARHFGGQFILRIEDTDTSRSTKESTQAILDAMAWLGLTYDEGPFYQTERLSRYQEVADQLLASGKAYRCNCSKERLEQLRAEQITHKQKPRYDGHCRKLNLDKDQPHVVRLLTPQTGQITFTDLVHGEITVDNVELDDLVLLRQDGMPTYNFSVVVDDSDMEITHVIRGDDHINNTPRQINILHALQLPVPEYAHVPTILGPDGKRLSKRHGATSVMEYQHEGFLPQAMLNCLVRLGWSHGDQELFTVEEMIALFDLTAVNKSAAAFNTDKLVWLNQHYLKSLPPESLVPALRQQCKLQGFDASMGPELVDVIAAQAERSKTLAEMASASRYFFEPVKQYNDKVAAKFLNVESLPVLTELLASLSALQEADWIKAKLHEAVEAVASKLDKKLGKVAQPLRVALTGNTMSPPIDLTLVLIGRKRSLERLEHALNYVRKQCAAS